MQASKPSPLRVLNRSNLEIPTRELSPLVDLGLFMSERESVCFLNPDLGRLEEDGLMEEDECWNKAIREKYKDHINHINDTIRKTKTEQTGTE